MKKRVSLKEAEHIASEFIGMICDDCELIEVAGSIRRKRPTVGDIEIVCIPLELKRIDLFGEITSMGRVLDDVLEEFELKRIKDGKLYKQIIFKDNQIDLFITTPEKWGVIFTIRTGSADFSHRLVTKKKYGGLMPSNMRVKEGRLYRGGTLIETPSEKSLFDAIGLKYVEPEGRFS